MYEGRRWISAANMDCMLELIHTVRCWFKEKRVDKQTREDPTPRVRKA